MADRPIIFSAPMVRALLAGRKTQTRRIIRPQPQPFEIDGEPCDVGLLHIQGDEFPSITLGRVIPGQVIRFAIGDRLWVREAWRPGYDAEGFRADLDRIARPSDFDPATTAIEYIADGSHELSGKDRPSIHMPRWASRLTLLVADVRVQRLQDISEADAAAEGAVRTTCANVVDPAEGFPSYRSGFGILWNSLHGADAWSANPWVAALTFTVERANIDALSAATRGGYADNADAAWIGEARHG